MKHFTQEQVATAVAKTSSMLAASHYLKVRYPTFRRVAILYGLFKPNQSGKGTTKAPSNKPFNLADILSGMHPQYTSYKLKIRLYKEGFKSRVCEICDIGDQWGGRMLEHELDHINGNSRDHSLSNLRIVCPNCHSQTDTFRSKNKVKEG